MGGHVVVSAAVAVVAAVAATLVEGFWEKQLRLVATTEATFFFKKKRPFTPFLLLEKETPTRGIAGQGEEAGGEDQVSWNE